MQIPLGEPLPGSRKQRWQVCGSVLRGSERVAAASVNTAFGRKKFLAWCHLYPWCPENCCRAFPRATSVKGRTGRNKSQSTSVLDARQMKSSGEPRGAKHPSLHWRELQGSTERSQGPRRPTPTFSLCLRWLRWGECSVLKGVQNWVQNHSQRPKSCCCGG